MNKISLLLLSALFSMQSSAVQTIVRADLVPGVSTSKDYMVNNGHFEKNVGNWVGYSDSAAISPVDGTGGSPSVTCTRTTSSPLAGVGSFLITKGASNRQGDGCSSAFSIDSTDQARVLEVTFDYEVASGTFAAGSSSSDSDVEVYLFDVSNAVLVPVSTYKLYASSTTTSATFSGYFQTASNSTSYRLILHTATTSASAYTLKLDNIKVHRSKYVYGTPITDWTAYTPTFTGYGTVTSIAFFSRRVGDSLEVKGKFVAGTGTATANQITIGYAGANANVTVDTSKVTANTLVGDAGMSTTASATSFRAGVLAPTSSASYIQISAQTSSNVLTGGSRNGSGLGFASGDTIEVTASVPIIGWSSSVQMSDSTGDPRVTAMQATGTVTGTITTSDSIVKWATVSQDTHGGYSTSTGIYTVPTAGFYHVHACTDTSATWGAAASTDFISLRVYTAAPGGAFSSAGIGYSVFAPVSSSVDPTACVDGVVNLAGAGQIKIMEKVGSGASSISLNTSDFSYFSVEKLQGPSSIAANETILAYYTSTAGQSITNGLNGTTAAIVNFDTKVIDTHGAVTTGASWVFKAPASGTYLVTAMAGYATATFTAGDSIRLGINVNATTDYLRLSGRAISATVSQAPDANGTAVIHLNAGDTMSVTTFHGESAARSLQNTGTLVYVMVLRIGL